MNALLPPAPFSAELSTTAQRSVLHALGTRVREVHDTADPAGLPLVPPPEATALRAGLGRSGLPAALQAEAPGYVARWADPAPPVVVHGDLRPEHVQVTDGELVEVTGWSEAVADRTYELGPVFFLLCGGGGSVFRAFLEGYRWPVTDGLADRVLAGALRRQAVGAADDPAYDLFADLPTLLDLSDVGSLDELADRLLGPTVRTAERFSPW